MEDQSDHYHQRSLKGKFIILSFKDNNIKTISLRLGNFKPGSSLFKVVKAIKSGRGKETNNLFISFALIPRRATLLYEIRQLKKAKKIMKFYADFLRQHRRG